MASVNLVKNVALDAAATSSNTGTVNEPTAAAFYDELYVTGNWFAARSSDGGSTWTAINPYTALSPAATAFCCDQVTVHERNRNLWIWVLQYERVGGTGTNSFRIVASTNGRPEAWFGWEFSPAGVNSAWSNLWFDYPDVATSNDHLYLSFNMFDFSKNWQQAVVFKFPLDSIVSRSLRGEYYVTTTHGSLRLTRGATAEMYFGSHRYTQGIRVFRWPDAPGSRISWFDVTPSAWSPRRQAVPQGPFLTASTTPDGANWLGRCDSRIKGAWTVGSQAGFLWDADARAGRPQPYVKAITVDVSNQSVVAEPDIWNDTVAWGYPSTCPNVNGVVGISLFYGGGGSNPTHVVGYYDANAWVVAATAAGTNGPGDNTWGDYLSCRTLDPDGTDWVASGYTLQGGNTRDFVQPRYVQFAAAP